MALPTTTNVYQLDLVEDERIEHVAKHHWMLLLYRATIPLILIVLTAALGIYRYHGGRLFVWGVAPPGTLDSFDTALGIGALLLAAAWWLSRRKNPKKEIERRRWELASMVALLLLLAFRYNGGRIFAMTTFTGGRIDLLDRVLIGAICGLLLVCFYLWLDWNDDSLIITNRRVVHDRRVLMQRHVQDQILIEKVQSVKERKDTYFAYWLDYGTIVIQAVNVGRRLTFEMGADPDATYKQLDGFLKAHRTAQSDEQYRAMIENNVYGAKPVAPKPIVTLRTYQAPPLLNWLFFDNPKIEDEKAVITWYSHWVFIFAAVAVPGALALLGLVVVLIAIRVDVLAGLLAIVASVLWLIITGAWATWRYVDIRDDVFVLTPTNIVRVEKKPFGPEDRRTASLGAIQNVSFDASIWGRIIGYGTIDVRTAGNDAGIQFHNIPEPRQVSATIYDYINEFKKGDRERTLKDTLTLLQTFHAFQQEHGEFEEI